MREVGRILGALAAGLALLAGGGAASGATLKAAYDLQGTRASTIPGAPELVDLSRGNRFATERVGDVTRQVLTFPKGGGLSLKTIGLVDPTSYSIVMDVRLDAVSGFRRLLDFGGGLTDTGLYSLDGEVLFWGVGDLAGDPHRSFDGSWVQVALTSERTLSGSVWTVAAVNGAPVAGVATLRDFRLGAAGLRLFQDNVRGPSRHEDSAGAVACVLVYDGALTIAELRAAVADPRCPLPRRPTPAELGFTPGTYVGRTSQGLPIQLVVGTVSVLDVAVVRRVRCSNGKAPQSTMHLEGGPLRDRRFSAVHSQRLGGRYRTAGRLDGERASGRLSRWTARAFGIRCVARGVTWQAHLRHGAS